jgi:hypothetical protein
MKKLSSLIFKMKRAMLCFILFSSFASLVYSQEKRMCNADALINKPDVIIQKDYISVGKVAGVTISVETITDNTNKQKLTALDLEFSTYENGSTTSRSVLLDPDETDALMTFLQTMQDDVVKLSKPTNDTEFSFVSKSGFEAGCYWNSGWGIYIKADTYSTHANVELSKEDFGALQSFLKQAKAKM